MKKVFVQRLQNESLCWTFGSGSKLVLKSKSIFLLSHKTKCNHAVEQRYEMLSSSPKEILLGYIFLETSVDTFVNF